ncbi:BatD family protein [Mucilaginibacter gossypii]|uniref:BatD family protein n=1 Tax=Mucilaginibacter gossypii TaxID=551996 RepID=UPI001FB7CFDD|nr:BatD family protein [Mucilaginibacter gossypii]QTE35922.2 BatD family protein [Mucilaginibacter gossypii]
MKYTLAMLVLLAGFYQTGRAQNFGAKATLDKKSILIGEQTQLNLSIRFHAKDSIGFPKLADSIGKIRIVNFKADTAFDKGDQSIETINRHYTITAFDSGTYIIPSYVFKSPVGDLLTDTLNLDVRTVAVDTTKAFYDIKQPLAVKYTFWDWLRDNWKLVTGILLGLIVIGAVVYYLLKRPKKEVIVEEVKPDIPLHIQALQKLEEIKNKQLWQHDQVKQYYIELSDVVREYLEKRYNIQALEQTSEEIFASLTHMDIASEDRNLLRQLLILADMVKFAKEKPAANENEKSMENAVTFIKDTQPHARPTDVNVKGDEAK